MRRAVVTELPVPKSVTAQVGADQVRGQKAKQALAEAAGRRRPAIVTDRDTGDLVYQVIDPHSRAVLFQSPHEAILKLRAYIARTEHQHERLIDERLIEEGHQERRHEEIMRKEIMRNTARK